MKNTIRTISLKSIPFLLGFLFLSLLPLKGQEILTAFTYFDLVSEQYGKIEDYETDVVFTTPSGVMEGVLYYKKPNLLRINFTKPQEQVLVVDGVTLVLYIPELRVTMTQQLKKRSATSVATIASAQGLNLLKRRYSISYMTESGSIPVPLDSGQPGSEMVVKLKLEWRSVDEGFRQIEIAVDNETKIIRRITGITAEYERIQLDFLDTLLNQGIPEGRFRYEPPNTANLYNNFLFEPEE